MSSLVASAVSGALLAILCSSAVWHLQSRSDLERSLLAHSVLPDTATNLVARAVGPFEALMATALGGSVLLAGETQVAALVALSAVFICYSAYLAVAGRRVAGGVDCGCGPLGSELTSISFLRPLTLAGLALSASMVVPASPDGGSLAIVGMAIVASGASLALLEIHRSNARYWHRITTAYEVR